MELGVALEVVLEAGSFGSQLRLSNRLQLLQITEESLEARSQMDLRGSVLALLREKLVESLREIIMLIDLASEGALKVLRLQIIGLARA